MGNADAFRPKPLPMFAGLVFLALAGAVTALPILSAPTSLHFPYGVQAAGVNVTNIGGSAVTIYTLDFTGDPPVYPSRGSFMLDFYSSTCYLGRVIAPGDACTVNYEYVRLTPEANSELVFIGLGFNGGMSYETMLVNLVADSATTIPIVVPALSRQMLMLLAGTMALLAVLLIRRINA